MPKLRKLTKAESEDNSFSSIGKFRIGNQGEKQGSQSHLNNRNPNQNEQNSSSSEDQSSQEQGSKFQNSNEGKTRLSEVTENRKQKRKSTEKKSLKKKYDADEILRKVREECAGNQDEASKRLYDDQTHGGIPDDVLVGFSGKKNRKKKDPNAIKIKNKFFSDVICDNDPSKNVSEDQTQELKRLEEQHKNILNLKNSKNAALMDQRKNQIQQRVTRIRERLQFKNAHEDIRFKQHIKQALDNVKDCDQVQIMIEAPKIFKGSSARQTDAALFIKNLNKNPNYNYTQSQPEESQNKSVQKQKQQKIKNRKVDRKQFYQEFTRQVKENNAMDFPTQTAGIWKKSSLEELENQFSNHQHLFKEETNSRSSVNGREKSLSIARRRSSEGEKPRLSREGSRSKIDVVEKEETKRGSKIEVVPEDISNQASKNNKIQPSAQVSISNIDQIPKPEEPKINQNQNKDDEKKKQIEKDTKKNTSKPKKKPKSKGKNPKTKKTQKVSKKIRQLFEEEAEDSQNGYGDDGYSSEEGDENSVQSMIEKKEVKYVIKNQRQARKKFMDDQAKKDEEMIQKIKDRIAEATKIRCEQNSQSRQRRKRRIIQAKKKFQKEDESNDGKFTEGQENSVKSSQNSKSSALNQFQQQLKSLQEEILKKKAPEPDSKALPFVLKKSKTVFQEMKITSIKVQPQANIEKRGGFLNNSKAITGGKIQPPKKSKSKPKNINF